MKRTWKTRKDDFLQTSVNVSDQQCHAVRKTRFILHMLDSLHGDLFFELSIKRILYCYREYQPVLWVLPIVRAFPQRTSHAEGQNFRWKTAVTLILDDLMDSINTFVADIFTKILHHRNLSVVYICQNLFNKFKYHRTISLNSHYIVLLRNLRDTLPVANLVHQIFASDWSMATNPYQDAPRE